MQRRNGSIVHSDHSHQTFEMNEHIDEFVGTVHSETVDDEHDAPPPLLSRRSINKSIHWMTSLLDNGDAPKLLILVILCEYTCGDDVSKFKFNLLACQTSYRDCRSVW